GVAFRFWYPLPLILLSYKELGYLIPRIHPHDMDRQLAAIDSRLFGVNPEVIFARLQSPALTLPLQLSYLCYYVFPVALGILLWRQRRFLSLQFLIFVILLGFYISYIGYIAVPAIGPRFFLSTTGIPPISGHIVGSIRKSLDSMEGLTRDCFPSGHTELTLLILFTARRFHRRFFWIMLVPALMLIFATMYLQYHYVIDVVAGAILAAIIVLAANWLHAALGGRKLTALD
ncbi:MAG TPA: phosphatase PAP2 family protein, partial [Blastocatellia bacterium]|nr:phosphatase PAP2 family protein [Blastocatellia bacterium]